MILYLDTSSLLKLFIAEPWADRVRTWAEGAEGLTTSRIAYPEAISGCARRRRDGSIGSQEFDSLLRLFDERWSLLLSVDLDERLAGHMAVKHSLRGLDAIHLAAALCVQNRMKGEVLAFTSFDYRLNSAATAEGLRVLTA